VLFRRSRAPYERLSVACLETEFQSELHVTRIEGTSDGTEISRRSMTPRSSRDARISRRPSPSLKRQMRYGGICCPRMASAIHGGVAWAISYMDTMEIVGFLGVHPEFRPVPLEQLAPAYNAAWMWLRNDFNKDTHLLSIFAFGRGDYGYITREREWQQTTTFLAKIMAAHKMVMQAMTNGESSSFLCSLGSRILRGLTSSGMGPSGSLESEWFARVEFNFPCPS
jgi:hypothetical protein